VRSVASSSGACHASCTSSQPGAEKATTNSKRQYRWQR
jgi:hypothetical protein